MADLKNRDIRKIDEIFDMKSGYVLDFSNRTFDEFFEDEFDLDIYDEEYAVYGTSKAKHLRAFIEVEDNQTVATVLKKLWDHRLRSKQYVSDQSENDRLKLVLNDVLERLDSNTTTLKTDALIRFKPDRTLNELIGSIERDIRADKALVALDRLHTYCIKMFTHILKHYGIYCQKNEALHARVGKYVKIKKHDGSLNEMSVRIMRNSISIFEQFNHLRNNNTFAHDNELLDQYEARFIFDSISSFLRFIRSSERDVF